MADLTPAEAIAAVAQYGSQRKAADAHRIPISTFRGILSRADRTETPKDTQDRPEWQWTEHDDNATAHFNSTRPIRTIEDIYQASNVDRDVWSVDKWGAKAHSTGMKLKVANGVHRKDFIQNYAVWVTFKRRIPKPFESALDLIAKRLAHHKPRLLRPIAPQRGHMLEISPFDVHLGRAVFEGSQSLADQREMYARAVDDLLRKASGFGIERITVPVGQDFFQIDNIQGTTTAGTPQKTCASLGEIYDVGHEAVYEMLNVLQRVAPVEVLYVPGNHDWTTSYFLCHSLKSTLRNNPRITFDVAPNPRKYIRHGQTIIGFTHGNEEKHADLGGILASECRQWWADVKYAEFHVGHFHNRKETRFNAADTHGNVVVRVLPSLSKTDEWHYRKGYVTGTRAAQAFVYSTDGLEAMFETHAA